MAPHRYRPISDYALLSDCHSAALVSKTGSVDWCSMHRFDDPPVFGRILDWNRGGYFRVSPRDATSCSREYLTNTNVLQTTFLTTSGEATVTDALTVAPTSDPASGTRVDTYHQLVRVVRCTDGAVDVEVDFEPRFEYELTVPRVHVLSDGFVTVFGGPDALMLQSDIPLEPVDVSACRGVARLPAGAEAWTSLTYDGAHRLTPRRYPVEELRGRLATTISFWRSWADRCRYDGPHSELVMRSALVLKGLKNAPTGAIAAAATTSLPEGVGGVRNWDYRYTWIRDAVLTLLALFDLHYDEEAHAFMQWLQRTTAGRAEDLQIMYGLGGERLLPEVELHQLDGYPGSRPVREAAEQFQLDVYGGLLDTAWVYHRRGGHIDESFWELLRGVVALVEERWDLPDQGIWEVRGQPQRFVSSQVMAWVAVDRGIRIAERTDLVGDIDRWRRVRDDIKQRVLRDGVDPRDGAFTRAYGGHTMDAANLLIPLVHFLPAGDPRLAATVRRVESELSEDGLVYRYREDDGLPGEEARGSSAASGWWMHSRSSVEWSERVSCSIASQRLQMTWACYPSRLIPVPASCSELSTGVQPHRLDQGCQAAATRGAHRGCAEMKADA